MSSPRLFGRIEAFTNLATELPKRSHTQKPGAKNQNSVGTISFSLSQFVTFTLFLSSVFKGAHAQSNYDFPNDCKRIGVEDLNLFEIRTCYLVEPREGYPGQLMTTTPSGEWFFSNGNVSSSVNKLDLRIDLDHRCGMKDLEQHKSKCYEPWGQSEFEKRCKDIANPANVNLLYYNFINERCSFNIISNSLNVSDLYLQCFIDTYTLHCGVPKPDNKSQIRNTLDLEVILGISGSLLGIGCIIASLGSIYCLRRKRRDQAHNQGESLIDDAPENEFENESDLEKMRIELEALLIKYPKNPAVSQLSVLFESHVEEHQCSVSLSLMDTPVTLPGCKHTFEAAVVRQLRVARCPLCSNQFNRDEIEVNKTHKAAIRFEENYLGDQITTVKKHISQPRWLSWLSSFSKPRQTVARVVDIEMQLIQNSP